MSSYQSKDELIHGRQLDAKSVSTVANLVAGTSDLPGRLEINNTTIAATVVTLDIGEPVRAFFKITAHNRLTGANIPFLSAPTLLLPNKLIVVLNGTGQTSVDFEFVFQPRILSNSEIPEEEAAGPEPVLLGGAGDFAALGKSAISTVPTSSITGDIGVSPAAASFITGFALVLDGGGTFSTSSQVTGQVFAADYAAPTPANLTAAVSAMEAAYTDASGRPDPDFTELGAGDISGMTLVPGIYKWSTGLLINTDVTLTGAAGDHYIFQVAGTLTEASATTVILSGGILPQNIFWAVAGTVTIGTTAVFNGVILAQTNIDVQTGATVNGRLLAQTAVSLDNATIVEA